MLVLMGQEREREEEEQSSRRSGSCFIWRAGELAVIKNTIDIDPQNTPLVYTASYTEAGDWQQLQSGHPSTQRSDKWAYYG